MSSPKRSPSEIACEILRSEPKGLHVDEIAKRAAHHQLIPADDVPSFAQRLSIALSQNLKTREPLFKKFKNGSGGFKRGVYALKVSHEGGKKRGRPKTISPEMDQTEGGGNQFTGKAGEYAVFSELLFRGFNASVMAVDDGIDLIASKENKFFHLQVKTAKPSNQGFTFTVKKSSFITHRAATTFYVLVVRRTLKNRHMCDFIILSSLDIDRLMKVGVIPSSETLSLRITLDDMERYVLNRREDMTIHVNRFDQIA